MALINCKNCGCQMSDKSEACPMCGMPVDADVEEFNKAKEAATPQPSSEPAPQQNNNEEPPQPKPEQPKKTSNTGLIIGIVAGVVVIIVAVLAFILLKNNKEQALAEQQAEYEMQMQEQQAKHEAELEEQRQQAQQNKLKGYEWLKGVWAAAYGPDDFGRVIVTDSYIQVVNSNMDDAFANVEDMPKEDYELKSRHDYISDEGDSEIFGFNEMIGVDKTNHSIYILQGEYNSIVLEKINEYSFEAAVFNANHNYPARVYSNAYDGFVNIRQEPNSKAPILGVLRNGPEGAVPLESEGEWKKVNCNGIVGYVLGKYLQDTPTEVFTGGGD